MKLIHFFINRMLQKTERLEYLTGMTNFTQRLLYRAASLQNKRKDILQIFRAVATALDCSVLLVMRSIKVRQSCQVRASVVAAAIGLGEEPQVESVPNNQHQPCANQQQKPRCCDGLLNWLLQLLACTEETSEEDLLNLGIITLLAIQEAAHFHLQYACQPSLG